MRRRWVTVGMSIMLASCAASGRGAPDPGTSSAVADPPSVPTTVHPTRPVADRTPAPELVGGLSRLAVADATGFHLRTAGGDIDFLTGVNVGPTVPGRQPGELAITAETWRRWLPMIAATGIDAIRVYTLQPPSFYEEFAAFNRAHPRQPLYLIHGIWIPEDLFAASEDLFDPALLDRLDHDIDDVVDAVNGHADLPPRPGYASGVYTEDVSPWLAAWAFGIEMDPVATFASEAKHPPMAYRGTYVSAQDGSTSTEAWLARALDRIAVREAAHGRTVPLTFTNWPTTDPLRHPNEPSESEDLVGIDANHLVASSSWPAGIFASYHAYPYFPDFQRYEPRLAGFEYEGGVDPYAGYLTLLRDHHVEAGLPTMILEFGVPSSLGAAHIGSLGRDQGGHDERAAMAFDAQMLRIQADLGLAGGFLFSWTDEWFKRTWNTVDRQLPADRRQLWHDALTNEQHFGLVATDPGVDGPPVVIDGSDGDWTATNSQVILESPGAVREVRTTHDEAFLYVRVRLDGPSWQGDRVTVGFDVVEGGDAGLPGRPDDGQGADTAVVVGPGATASAFVRSDNDPNPQYTAAAGVAGWNPQRLLTSRPLEVPGLGIEQPAEWFDLNPLPTGTSDPDDPGYDSRTVWGATEDVIELRVPWAMVGFADPSSRQALVVAADGTFSTVTVPGVGVAIAVGPDVFVTAGYRWDQWNVVEYRERPKAGLEELVAEVGRITGK